MRIVHIEDLYTSGTGYQINILPKYQVKQGHEVIIVTAEFDIAPDYIKNFVGDIDIKKQDEEFSKKTGVKVIRVPMHAYKSGRGINKLGFHKLIESLKPDVLYVHGDSTFIAMQYILRAKWLNYPVVFDSHMLEMASENRFSNLFRLFFRSIFTPIIKKYKYVFIRIQDDDYLEKCLGIPLEQCPWISVGSDTLLFKPDNQVKQDFRLRHNIKPDDFVVVYTGKLIESKGGILLAEAFGKKLNNGKNKNVVLITVGNINNDDYGNKVKEIFKSSENRIIHFNTQQYLDLPQFYQAADLSVFAKQCSLSFYDAQACGLPVVSEDNNINIDRHKFGNGLNFQSGNVDDFRKKIVECIEMPFDQFNSMKQNAYKLVKENYNYEDIAKEYTEILIHEYEKKQPRTK
jgi:glycosyltransferase involved in cell wall biosynthesis